MNFKKIEMENFLVISKADLELDQRGLVLIQGENMDNPSAESNGSGKSTLLEALSWCLYGVTAKGVSADDVINIKAGKNCYVSVTIKDGDTEYKICRYRKHDIHKSCVTIEIDGVSQETPTVAAGDALIEKIIGMPLEMFKATVYCGQEQMPEIPKMTDKQIKELIENAAGLEILQSAYDKVKQMKQDVDFKNSTIAMRVEQIKKDMEYIRSCEKDLRMESLIWSKVNQQEYEISCAEISREKDDYKKEVAEFSKNFGKDLSKELKEKQDTLTNIKSMMDEVDQLKSVMNGYESQISLIDNAIETYKADIDKINFDMAEITSGTKSVCNSCGRKYDKEHTESAINAQAQLKGEVMEKISALKKPRLKEEAGYEKSYKEWKDAYDNLPSISELSKEIQDMTKYESDKVLEFKRLSSKKDVIKMKQDNADKHFNRENPHEISIQNNLNILENKEKELLSCTEEFEESLKEISVTNNLVAVFGPAGVRAHILDAVTPFLNSQTEKYLNTLSAGSIKAIWTTVSNLKNGSVKEKFQIAVKTTDGVNNYKQLSGGEKRKVNLACVLALQDLVSSKTDKSIDIWIGDEIDDALDSAGLEMMMEVLNEKVVEKGTVLVISHNDLKDWISNHITVVKKNGVSTIGE